MTDEEESNVEKREDAEKRNVFSKTLDAYEPKFVQEPTTINHCKKCEKNSRTREN